MAITLLALTVVGAGRAAAAMAPDASSFVPQLPVLRAGGSFPGLVAGASSSSVSRRAVVAETAPAVIPRGGCNLAYGSPNVLQFQVTNHGSVASTFIGTVTLPASLTAITGSCTAGFGTCTIVNATTVRWTGTLSGGQSVGFQFSAQVAASTPSDTLLCWTLTVEVPGGQADPPAQSCGRTCQNIVPTAMPTATPSPTIGSAPSCQVYHSSDVPKAIPDLGSASSTISVPAGMPISSVRILALQGTHSFVQDLEFHLISPANTEVSVINHGQCGNDDNFNLSLDDNAVDMDVCPLNNGMPHQPDNPLSSFTGQSPGGTWTLRIFDLDAQDSGQLQSWSLEICSTTPSGCVTTLATEVPRDIPDLGVATSTLTLPAGMPIADINVVSLRGRHTFVQDLEFHLISPMGTDVAIINHGQCGNADDFNLSLDDSAANDTVCPLNDGMAHQPDNPLSAFHGQSPGGVWTLKVFDRDAQDAGHLDGWGLQICPPATPSPGCVNRTSADVPKSIPDQGVATSTVTLPAGLPISDVNLVSVQGTHTFVQDLEFHLISPMGTDVTVVNHGQCGNADDFNLSLDDGAANDTVCPLNDGMAHQPDNPLSAFNGENPGGLWTLKIIDLDAQDSGTLTHWELQVCGPTPTPTPVVCADGGGNGFSGGTSMGGAFTGTVTLPPGLFFPANACTASVGTCTISGSTATWSATLQPGQTGSFEVSFFVSPGVPAGTELCTTGSVQGPSFSLPGGSCLVACGPPMTGTPSASRTPTRTRTPSVTPTQADCIHYGQPLPQPFFVENFGSQPTTVVATNVLPPELRAIPGSCTTPVGSCTILDPFTVRLTATLAGNQRVDYSFAALLEDDTPPGTRLCEDFTTQFGNNAPTTQQFCGFTCGFPMPTSTVTRSPTATFFTPTATRTHTPSITSTPTRTVTGTQPATHTVTRTHSFTRTETPTMTSTPTQTSSRTMTERLKVTYTRTPTGTTTATATVTQTGTITTTATTTATATVTATGSMQPSVTPTLTRSPSATQTATGSALPSSTATSTPSPTATATGRIKVTFTRTPTPSVTTTPTVTPTGNPGDGCTGGSECQSGNCVDGRCCDSPSCPVGQFCNIPMREGACAEPGPNGAPCATPQQCASGNCVDGFCCGSASCPTGELCNSGECGPPANGGTPCSDPAQCTSGFCVDGFCCGSGICPQGEFCTTGQCEPPGANGAPCSEPNHCQSGSCIDGFCCSTPTCPADQFCNTGMCGGASGNGSGCFAAEHCLSGFCVDRTCCDVDMCPAGELCNIPRQEGVCSGPAALGNPCTDPRQCQSGQCTNGACCDAAACNAGESCNLPGHEGQCAPIPVCDQCDGDCNCSGQVTVEELVTMVNLARSGPNALGCRSGDGDGDGAIHTDEVLTAIGNALAGCPLAAPTPTPTPTATTTPTPGT